MCFDEDDSGYCFKCGVEITNQTFPDPEEGVCKECWKNLDEDEIERVECGRCGKDVTFKKKYDGDPDFNEKLCQECCDALEDLSNHNRPIFASLGCKPEKW